MVKAILDTSSRLQHILDAEGVVKRVLAFLSDPPIVTLSIEPRSVLEGDRVTFTCQAHANPPIMGYRSAKHIKSNVHLP